MLVFFLLLAAVVFSAAAAGKTEIFDDQVLSGESIEIDDFTFIITMNKYGNAIFIDAGTMFQTVPLFGCKSMESFEICFKNTTYDEEDNELYAEVNISRYKPDISITRTINQTEFFVGQEAEVTITMPNTGDTAPQVILTDDYPAGIEIYDFEGGCREHENQVYWSGHLDEDESKECRFIIKAIKEVHQSLVAHLKYWDGFKWIDKYSSTMTLDTKPILTVYSSVVREDYEVDGTEFDFEEESSGVNIGETLRLIVNITNEYFDEIDVNAFEISLPPDLEYKSTGYLRFNYVNATGNRSSLIWSSDRIRKITDRLLRWDGKIGANRSTSKSFILKLKATKSGNQNVLIHTDYEYEDLRLDDTQYVNFRVGDPGIAIRMAVEDESKRFAAPERLDEEEDTIDIEALHPYRIRIYTQNKNKFSKVENVYIDVITDLAGFKRVHYPEIEEEGQKIPYSLVLIPPSVETSKMFETNVSITYKNEFGERHYNSTVFEITVIPSKDLTIDVESSEGFVLESREETEITVTLDNERLVDIKNVDVQDRISEGLHIEGVHAKKMKLNRESETEAYTYRIIPPVVHEKTWYNITTRVSFFDPDLKQTLNFSKTTTITVNPLQPDVSIDVTLDDPDDIYPGTLIPVEYTVGNDEEEELVRELTVHFPLQEEVDLIGPRTFLIDKLDPGEEIVIKDIVKIRPKVAGDDLELGRTRVEYYDNYGNLFDENSTEDTINVESGKVNGPAIFMSTLVPDVVNISTKETVELKIRNDGSSAADITVEQGKLLWDTTVAAGSIKTIKYAVKFDTEGNYTIHDPVAKFKFQGLDAYTKGSGAEVQVKLLLGPLEEVEEEAPVVEEAEIPVPEKEEMSFEEYEELAARERRETIMRYSLIGVVAIVVLVLVAAYIGYRKRKGPSAVSFLETEK